MVAITNCLREQDQYVRDAAAMCLFKLHSPDYILEWGSSPNFMESFWKISSQVVLTLAKQLLDTRERDDGIKRLLELLKKLFESRNEFLRMHQVKTKKKEKRKFRNTLIHFMIGCLYARIRCKRTTSSIYWS